MLPRVGGINHQNMGGLLLSEHYGKTLWFARKLRTVFKHYSSTSSNTCAGPVTANPKTLNPKALNLKTLKPLTLKTLNPKPEKKTAYTQYVLQSILSMCDKIAHPPCCSPGKPRCLCAALVRWVVSPLWSGEPPRLILHKPSQSHVHPLLVC